MTFMRLPWTRGRKKVHGFLILYDRCVQTKNKNCAIFIMFNKINGMRIIIVP